MALGIQGIQIQVDPGQAVNEVMASNWTYIGQILIPALMGMIFKIVEKIQSKTWSWRLFWKSPNLATQAITVLSGILAFVGIILPETAPQELTAALFSGSIFAIIAAVIANVLNPLWHFLKDLFKKKDVPQGETPKV